MNNLRMPVKMLLEGIRPNELHIRDTKQKIKFENFCSVIRKIDRNTGPEPHFRDVKQKIFFRKIISVMRKIVRNTVPDVGRA